MRTGVSHHFFVTGHAAEQAIPDSWDARTLRVSEQIGGECAGAISFFPEDEGPPKNDTSYRELTAKEFANMLVSCRAARSWPERTAFASRSPERRTKSPCALAVMRLPFRVAVRPARTS